MAHQFKRKFVESVLSRVTAAAVRQACAGAVQRLAEVACGRLMEDSPGFQIRPMPSSFRHSSAPGPPHNSLRRDHLNTLSSFWGALY